MNHLVVSISYDLNDDNSQNIIMMRSLLEEMSGAGNWHQILPSLIALKTDYSIDDVYKGLSSLNTDHRIFIAEVKEWRSNAERTDNSLTRMEY